jgi:DNA mismatch repair protein MutL
MPKVFVLPDHIASQIAAGEVVERPASVVKELVENSLDAGATQIEVKVSSNCRDIRIADNGCGMDAEDALLAFQRHATSKIRSADDLWKLQSFGFRGEALPSIASVARVTCYTRTRHSQVGSRIDAADGKTSCSETGCSPGTVMEITDLFYNVPARLSFLKKGATELAHVEEALRGLAIAHPDVSFHLINNGQSVLKTTGSGELARVVVETGLLSGDEQLCSVEYQDERSGVRVSGMIARPLHFRGDRKGIFSMVNKRPVRCHLTYKALEYAYSDLIPRGRHPLAVVAIEIDPQHVDVNIHPTKKEIKYSQGNDVYTAIQRALMQALRQEERAKAQLIHTGESIYAEPQARYASQAGADLALAVNARSGFQSVEDSSKASQMTFKDQLSYVPPARFERALVAETPSPARQLDYLESQLEAPSLPSGWHVAGYVLNTYIVVETGDGMMLVEQHIAHERTLYERLLAQQNDPGQLSDYSQRLIVSAPLSLSSEQTALLQHHLPLLKKLRFDFEIESPGQSTVLEVPLELAGKNYAVVVQELLDQIATADSANVELEATKSIACQSAIKDGMPLSDRDIVKLLADWHDTPRNHTCPHGRPICLKFSKDKLFQMFHPA